MVCCAPHTHACVGSVVVVVSSSTFDCLETVVCEMTYYAFSVTLNAARSHDLNL